MQSHLKLFVFVFFIFQVTFCLNIKAQDSHSINLNHVLGCQDCKPPKKSPQ
jgi:hypothetical protein